MKNNYLLEQVDEYLIELKIKEIIESREFSSSPVHSYDMEEVPLFTWYRNTVYAYCPYFRALRCGRTLALGAAAC